MTLSIELRSLDEDGEDVKVKVCALFANNNQHTIISDRLASKLHIKAGKEVKVGCLFSKTIYSVFMPRKPVTLYAPGFIKEGDSILISPLINKNNAFYEIILGQDFFKNNLVHIDKIINNEEKKEPSRGPGYKENVVFMGHNATGISKEVIGTLNALSSEYILRFDGASRGNPGHSGAAASIYKHQGSECIWFDSEYLGANKTNNQAEYKGLILGLEECVRKNLNRPLLIQGDSELIIKQMKGEYQVKHKKLIPLYNKARSLISILRFPVLLRWIPREKNIHCDKMANDAIDTYLEDDKDNEEDDEDPFDDEEEVPEEILARAELGIFPGHKADGDTLSWDEIRTSWGGCLNFMLSYGLKPWKSGDVQEAREIMRSMRQADLDS
jgi:ribonuclease HI